MHPMVFHDEVNVISVLACVDKTIAFKSDWTYSVTRLLNSPVEECIICDTVLCLARGISSLCSVASL